MSEFEERIVTTEELVELLKSGEEIYLPEVKIPGQEILANFDDQSIAYLCSEADDNPIISVEYVGEEEVQCIAVEDEKHMYITDDFIPTHNTSNIVFLKSTDDTMLEQLEKMSGTRHTTYRDQKMITHDAGRIFMKNDPKTSITVSTVEEPVISYNDLAFISERNSIVFRAGDSPIWNRNEMILPMSWRLFQDNIKQPGKQYSLQTIPTLSSALDFDVRKNQPDFNKMLEKRVRQAIKVDQAQEDFMEAFGYDDYDIEQLDPDVYAGNIMDIINARIAVEDAQEAEAEAAAEEYAKMNEGIPISSEGGFSAPKGSSHFTDDIIDNVEVQKEIERQERRVQLSNEKKFANKRLSQADLIEMSGEATHYYDQEILKTFAKIKHHLFNDGKHFSKRNGGLYSRDGLTGYIVKEDETKQLKELNQMAKQKDKRVFSEEDLRNLPKASYSVTNDFIQYIANLDTWVDIAEGKFEMYMARFIES